MKSYTLLYIIGGLLLSSPTMAQIKVRWTPFPQQELGIVNEADGPVTRTFVAHNEGDYSWQLVRSYTSCGCTSVEMQQEQIVRPGDSTLVNVTFNPKGKAGPFRETANIQLTDGEEVQNEAIILTGEVRRSDESIQRQFPITLGEDIRLSTAKVDFGELRRDASSERHVAIHNSSDNQLTLTAKPSSASLSTEWKDNSISILPGQTIDLLIRWEGKAEKQWGLSHERLTLGCVERKQQIALELSAILLPAKNIDPSKTPTLQTERRIDLGPTPPGKTITKQLTIRNTGNASLNVLRIYSDKPGIEVLTHIPVRIEPSQTATIKLRITPEGDTELPITLISDDAHRPRQTLRMRIK